MTREIISTDKAPSAIGTYSQAVQVGDTVYLSGHSLLVPETMEIVSGGLDVRRKQSFKNMNAVCEAAGGSVKDVVKVDIYLTDLTDFATVNKLMAEDFEQPYPARAAVGVSPLPKEAGEEIEGTLVPGA